MSDNEDNVTPFMKLFWEQQKAAQQKGFMQYHPMIIRFCLSSRRAEMSTATMSRQIKTFEFRGVSLARLLTERQNPKKEKNCISLHAYIDIIFIF